MRDVQLSFATLVGKGSKTDFMLVVAGWHDMLQKRRKAFRN